MNWVVFISVFDFFIVTFFYERTTNPFLHLYINDFSRSYNHKKTHIKARLIVFKVVHNYLFFMVSIFHVIYSSTNVKYYHIVCQRKKKFSINILPNNHHIDNKIISNKSFICIINEADLRINPRNISLWKILVNISFLC